MIQITHKDLDTLVQNHYEELSKKVKKEFPCFSIYSIETVLKAKPEKLNEIAKWFLTLSPIEKEQYNYIIALYANFTTKKEEYDAYDFVSTLGVNTCPYCNRNYTFSVCEEDKTLRPDIDHFYDKSTYPILALSFYNLIPSCVECNRTLKRTKEFSVDTHIHPYLESLNDYAKFKLNVTKSSFYHSTKGFEIEFKSANKKAQKNIDDLKLDDIYKEGYKNIVLELIQKAEIYNESYIDELYKNYEGTLFKNREDVLRYITGGYIDDKDLDKRPLSKLIKDISEELNFM